MIEIDGQSVEIRKGLVRVSELYELTSARVSALFFNSTVDAAIAVRHEDYLIVRGGERFVTADDTDRGRAAPSAVRPRFNDANGPELSGARITGRELKAHDSEFPAGRLFADVDAGADAEIVDDMTIIVQEADSFFVVPAGDDGEAGAPIDIELCGKHGRRPPKGYRYRIRVDGEKYIVQSAEITGAGILGLAGKTTDEWSLNRKHRGGRRERIASDQVVNLAEPGVERFETVRRQAQQGDEPYDLLPEDKEYLDANHGGLWRKLLEGSSKRGLLIEGFPIPGGYTSQNSNLMILMPHGYPGEPLDTFYFEPPLSRADGKMLRQLMCEEHFGRPWQRWSRHYDWVPGSDNLVKHIGFVTEQLRSEVSA